jgi:hydroxymethylpyrimidine/phosphomethylpyrimidine kinase
MLHNRYKIPKPGQQRPSVLTIAGADSGGAAGIQADLKVFAAFGLHGLSAITAVTAQNTHAVRAIHVVPARDVQQQLEAVAEDFSIHAVKIGMLATAATIKTVAHFLRDRALPVVLDPVLVSSSGTNLLPLRARGVLRDELIPLSHVLTPNLPEAALLIGRRGAHMQERELVRELVGLGAHAVLLKGGHSEHDPVCDYFATSRSLRVFRHARVPIEARGTGCGLSAAMAAALASGHELEDAVRIAERYLQRALRGAYRAGRGRQHVLPGAASRHM